MPRTQLTLEAIPEGTTPLYERIAEQFAKRIDAGVWAAGEQLKSEFDLAAELGVARGTLRKAIARLVESGHLVHRHGLGTFVSQQNAVRMPGRFESLGERMERGGLRFTTAELHREVVPAEELEDPTMGDALRLRRLRSLDGKPVSVLVNRIPLRLAPGIEDVDVTTSSLYALLEKTFRVQIVRAELSFSAQRADAELATLLEVEPGAPLTRLSQTTYGVGDVVVDLAETWIRPDRHQPTVSLWRSGS